MERSSPPSFLIHVVNPVLRRLLTSPLHRPMSRGLMVLHVTGRRTGHVYDIVVGRHEVDGRLMAHAGGTWRANLRGGADLRVTLDGRERAAHAVLEEDPDRLVAIYRTLLERFGRRHANRVGLTVNVDRDPTPAELREALTGDAFAIITLTEPSR
ncbi:hypothetical protein [Intrasporangium sp.]|uniref:hypothetical protein n=1 Tax=Intrasporangium sp. TaxID=1925024 RepID=UPI0032218AA6